MEDSVSHSKDKIDPKLNMGRGQIALVNNKDESRNVQISIDCEVTSDPSEKIPVQRNLKLSVDFIFEIVMDENEDFSEDTFKNVTQEYGLNFCAVQLQNVVKDITSIDYGSPMLFRGLTLPTGISVVRESPDNKEEKGN